MFSSIRGKRLLGAGAVLVLSASLAACSPGNSSSPSESGSQGASDEIVAEASANVEQFFANDGAEFALEAVPDTDALRGKTLMYLSAGTSSPSGTAGVQALEQLAAQLGFELVVFDGQFTPSRYQEGMRQAISQNVDALVVYGVDCAGNEAALKEVRAAGIPIIGSQSVDCNEIDTSAEGLFDAQPLYPVGDEAAKIAGVWAANGAAQADYLISKLNGDVKVISFDVPDFAVTAALGEGFRARMSECSTCEILETVQVGVADFGPSLQQKAEQALLKNPDANAVQINYDDLLSLGVTAAIDGSGRAGDLLVIAGTGYESALDLIRDGGSLDAGWVQNHPWDHYALVDTVLRVLGGQEAAVSGIPVILYDAEHNMPETGEFIPTTDFVATFEKAWGLR